MSNISKEEDFLKAIKGSTEITAKNIVIYRGILRGGDPLYSDGTLGEQLGQGHYWTPSIKTAEEYATFDVKGKHPHYTRNGEVWQMVFDPERYPGKHLMTDAHGGTVKAQAKKYGIDLNDYTVIKAGTEGNCQIRIASTDRKLNPCKKNKDVSG